MAFWKQRSGKPHFWKSKNMKSSLARWEIERENWGEAKKVSWLTVYVSWYLSKENCVHQTKTLSFDQNVNVYQIFRVSGKKSCSNNTRHKKKRNCRCSHKFCCFSKKRFGDAAKKKKK